MLPFLYQRAQNSSDAINAFNEGRVLDSCIAYLAGGTTLLDLMKLDVLRPEKIIDINDLTDQYSNITHDSKGIYLGALARMADTAEHPIIRRDYPVVMQSLYLAASAQLRNVASLGGNVLQR